MKAVSILFAALVATLGTASFSVSAADASDADRGQPESRTRPDLAARPSAAQGKVVKVNNGIMGRNFVHVQDGSGDASKGTNNLLSPASRRRRG
jgi:hypothetical protein